MRRVDGSADIAAAIYLSAWTARALGGTRQRGKKSLPHSSTGTRTQVDRVKAGYPNQLDYRGKSVTNDSSVIQQP